jgi:ubiquinone/menaquinone biosynthesis C-methylase UbiE
MEYTAKKERIRDHYNQSASTYDNRYRHDQYTKFELLFHYWESFSGIGLDFGCGTGLLFDFLTRTFQRNTSINLNNTFLIDQRENNTTDQDQINADEENLLFQNERIHSKLLSLINPKVIQDISRENYWRNIGIDISIEMLQLYAQKIRSHKLLEKHRPIAHNIHLICCDGEHLPLRENQFDFILAMTTLQNLTDINRGLQELAWIKKQSCEIGISLLKKSLTKDEFKHQLAEYLGDLLIISSYVGDQQLTIEDWICYVAKKP